MHGDLDQKLRMKILQAFRDGELKLLIASDVAARGLDIPNVSHIFNFDVPIHSEDYVHRIGRTGRAGRWGKSFTLALPSDEKYLAKIEELVKKTIPVDAEPARRRRAAARPLGAAPSGRAGPSGRRERRRRGARRAPSATPRPEPRPQRAERDPRPEPAPGTGRARPAPRPRRRCSGMGDHVPAFLMRELRVDGDPEPEATSETEVEPAANAPAVGQPVEKPKARRRSRSRTAEPAASAA